MYMNVLYIHTYIHTTYIHDMKSHTCMYIHVSTVRSYILYMKLHIHTLYVMYVHSMCVHTPVCSLRQLIPSQLEWHDLHCVVVVLFVVALKDDIENYGHHFAVFVCVKQRRIWVETN